MRTPLALFLRLSRLFWLSACIAGCAVAQTTPNTPTDANSVTTQAIAAFSATPVSQVQLSGTAKGYAGSSQPNGTFTVTLKSTGESTLQLNLADLTRTETTGAYSSPPQCQWTGADGERRNGAVHNCLLPLHWLLPVLMLQNRASSLNQSVIASTDQGTSVQALSLKQPPVDSSDAAEMISSLSSATLSVDGTTLLPTSFSFAIHPDNNQTIDIPIVVRYSDYRQVSGTTLPFHIQKYLNNGLVLDLTVTTAEVQ